MGVITGNKQGLKVLAAGAVLQFMAGILYVWSVFKNPVSAHYGWDPVDVGLNVSFMLCFFVVGILVGGAVQAKIGTGLTVLGGGLMVAAGMLATAFIPAAVAGEAVASVYLIYVLYGMIGGFGCGAAYNALLSTAQKWFPQNKGFATGVSVGSFGFATVIFAPLIVTLIDKFGVPAAFLILAGIFAAAFLSLFSFIKTPDDQTAAPSASSPALSGKQYTTLEMIKSGRYYLIMPAMMLGTSVFFIINPDLKDLAVNRGAENFAVGLVMLTGVANALGRLCVPIISDKLGREQAGMAIIGVTALGAFGLCFAEGFLLIAVIAAAAFCYGGVSGLFPVITSENFGLKNIGSNYGAVMIGFMLSALLFPMIFSKIADQTLRFASLGVLAVVGAGLLVILRMVNMKAQRGKEVS